MRINDIVIRTVFFLLLMGFWLLLSGRHTVFVTSLGVASAILVVVLLSRMHIIDKHLPSLKSFFRWLGYSIWLSGRIVVSCVKVAFKVLHPRLAIAPGFIRVPMTQKHDFTKMIHANSITLTPGTVSTGLDEASIEVHALDCRDQTGAQAELDRRVSHIEGES